MLRGVPRMTVHDLASLDRAVQAAHAALAASERDGTAPGDVLAAYRPVSGKAAYDALCAFPEGRERALAVALARHVSFLTIARVAGPARRELVLVRRDQGLVPPDGLPRVRTTGNLASLDDALREALAASSVEASDAWLDVGARAAPRVIAAERRCLEVENEVRARLGVPAEPDATAGSANAFLESTAELTRAMVREGAGSVSAGAMLQIAVARAAGHGWPRVANLDAIVGTFGPGAASMGRLAERVVLSPVELLGASSWARAYARVGFALHARARSVVPFALRLGPEHLAAHRTGLLVASALASRVFHSRALDCGDRVARAQARAIALVALLAARTDASRVSTFEPARRAELLIVGTAPNDVAAVLLRRRADASARWSAWLALPSDLAAAVERYDEDYFRNPRFWLEVAVRAASTEEPIEGDEAARGAALARELERRVA